MVVRGAQSQRRRLGWSNGNFISCKGSDQHDWFLCVIRRRVCHLRKADIIHHSSLLPKAKRRASAVPACSRATVGHTMLLSNSALHCAKKSLQSLTLVAARSVAETATPMRCNAHHVALQSPKDAVRQRGATHSLAPVTVTFPRPAPNVSRSPSGGVLHLDGWSGRPERKAG